MTIEGFDDGVDGYHDVADQLRQSLLSRASEARGGDRSRDGVREAFLDAIGGLPGRPDPVPVEHAGTVPRDGYSVERLVLEPLPDVHVPANCYVPDGDGPHPAVLLCAGHHPFPKADQLNQRACIELARHGVVALVYDPPGVGERQQYPDAVAESNAAGDDPDAEVTHDGIHPVFHGSGVYAHSLAGQQANYAGGNVARWFVHEARCALDHLESRSDVDADRLGVAGTSGGGMLTVYLALVDDRPDALAPCCSVCDREHAMRAGFPVDHEQVLHGALPGGFDVVDLTSALAPTPLCIGAARSDFFPIEGVHDAFERLERAYDSHDASGDCVLQVADTGHAAVSEIPGVLAFVCTALDAAEFDAREFDPETDCLDRDALQCTPSGSVLESSVDERTLTDLVVDDLVDGRSTNAGPDADAVLERVRERFPDDHIAADLHPRVVATDDHGDLGVERLFWKSEYDPDVVVPGVLVTTPNASVEDADSERAAPAVVCFESGTRELPERTADLAALAREHGAALAVDPRGVGATRQRETPATWGDPEYHGVYGTTHALASHATVLGDSLFAQRVRDVRTAGRVLRDRTDADALAYVGDGIGAYHALYAAGIDVATAASEPVDAVRHLGDDPMPSFRARATDAAYGFEPRLDAHDVLACDVPAVRDALVAGGVSVPTSDS